MWSRGIIDEVDVKTYQDLTDTQPHVIAAILKRKLEAAEQRTPNEVTKDMLKNLKEFESGSETEILKEKKVTQPEWLGKVDTKPSLAKAGEANKAPKIPSAKSHGVVPVKGASDDPIVNIKKYLKKGIKIEDSKLKREGEITRVGEKTIDIKFGKKVEIWSIKRFAQLIELLSPKTIEPPISHGTRPVPDSKATNMPAGVNSNKGKDPNAAPPISHGTKPVSQTKQNPIDGEVNDKPVSIAPAVPNGVKPISGKINTEDVDTISSLSAREGKKKKAQELPGLSIENYTVWLAEQWGKELSKEEALALMDTFGWPLNIMEQERERAGKKKTSQLDQPLGQKGDDFSSGFRMGYNNGYDDGVEGKPKSDLFASKKTAQCTCDEKESTSWRELPKDWKMNITLMDEKGEYVAEREIEKVTDVKYAIDDVTASIPIVKEEKPLRWPKVQRIAKKKEGQITDEEAFDDSGDLSPHGIAETYINGNLGDAKQAIGNDLYLFTKVQDIVVNEYGGDIELFNRRMTAKKKEAQTGYNVTLSPEHVRMLNEGNAGEKTRVLNHIFLNLPKEAGEYNKHIPNGLPDEKKVLSPETPVETESVEPTETSVEPIAEAKKVDADSMHVDENQVVKVIEKMETSAEPTEPTSEEDMDELRTNLNEFGDVLQASAEGQPIWKNKERQVEKKGKNVRREATGDKNVTVPDNTSVVDLFANSEESDKYSFSGPNVRKNKVQRLASKEEK